MAAMSSGTRGKPLKGVKKGTPSTKAHRFEPFSQRIARIKIDPIHRVQRSDLETNGDQTMSYFRTSLEQWMDLNLSENFTEFSRKASPLSESLPQILHYEDKLMALLVEYIGKRDRLSLEPLLILVAQFAHDLGPKFEKHFAEAVSLVASVAATHPDVEVIEWSFTCLAWIFKFLSRLLVPDLRQLLEIMIPYLGKQRQKAFVVRFAADAVSFLVRRAGAVYHKNKAPLDRVVSHLFQDLRDTPGQQEISWYQKGLMTMFAEAMKGVNGGIHASGADVLRGIITNLERADESGNSKAEEVLSGVIINLIHHSKQQRFQPIMEVVHEQVAAITASSTAAAARVGTQLLFVTVVARKGSRIEAWRPVHEDLLSLLQLTIASPGTRDFLVPRILSIAVVALQTAPMDEMLPSMRPLMDAVTHDNLARHFLSFCSLFSRMGSERFQEVVLPYFQKFVLSHWNDNEDRLCKMLPQLHKASCITSEISKKGYIACPDTWKTHMVHQFRQPALSEDHIAQLDSYTRVIKAVSVTTNPSALPDITNELHRLLTTNLHPTSSVIKSSDRFIAGQGLISYVRYASQLGNLDDSIWSGLCSVTSQYSSLSTFLEGVLDFITATPAPLDVSKSTIEPLSTSLLANLSSSSHLIRLLSLKILGLLFARIKQNEASAISTAIRIESTPLDLQTARLISMDIRKLASMYNEASSEMWLDLLIPNFCFGLLTSNAAQISQDTCDALKSISDNRTGEKVVADLALQWLQQPYVPTRTEQLPENKKASVGSQQRATDFQCWNLWTVESMVIQSFEEMDNAQANLLARFEDSHSFSSQTPATARSQALRVLNYVPDIAERRSRQIVPYLLTWTSQGEDCTSALETSTKSSFTLTAEESPNAWNLRERKALLTLFGHFSNPRVLYKSTEVYQGLLELLTNGDAEIQKSALRSIFTWKSPSIQPYAENLLNLLDDAMFREEVTLFLHIGEDDSRVQDDHREELLHVLLRLLYGRLVARTGSQKTSGGQETRRRAILRALSQLQHPGFSQFLRIAFGPLNDLRLVENGFVRDQLLAHEFLSTRRQYGVLKMVESMFETLQSRMSPFADQAFNAVLYCLVQASRTLFKASLATGTSSVRVFQDSLLRSIRQTGIRCADMIFESCPDVNWEVYLPLLFEEVIDPRLEKFAIETAQGVSGLLHLFGTWASSSRTVLFLSRYNRALMHKILDCLDTKSAQDEVKIFVLEQILQRNLDLANGRQIGNEELIDASVQDSVRAEVISPNVDYCLSRLASLLKDNPSRQLLGSAVHTLPQLAPFVSSSVEAGNLIAISVRLLRQPVDRVSPKTKGGLLKTLQHMLPLCYAQNHSEIYSEVFQTVSSLFDYFKDQKNREVLSSVLAVIAINDPDLAEVAELCAHLNSFSLHKLDEVDHERRLGAFNSINEDLFAHFTSKQWRPIVFNMLYHIKDEEELAIRSSASFGLRRFIERAASVDRAQEPGFEDLIRLVLLPALLKGVRVRSELSRAEYVSTVGFLAKKYVNLPEVSDMRVLLVNDDDEASFFTNILHIQQHRRLRALRRLATEASQGNIRSSNISNFFLPLVEHFIFDSSEDENAHNLTAEAISTVGTLSEWLEWNQFRAVFRRYRGYMESKPELEKTMIKLLSCVTDALCRAVTAHELKAQGHDQGPEPPSNNAGSLLASTMPVKSKVGTELSANFMPYLMGFIHNKEESEISRRVPVAITTVKLLKLLPLDQLSQLLPPVLLDVSNILRSRSKDSRDVARRTLAEITSILGPSYFGYVLKELRSSLARGYQLHVLSFTIHSILVSTADIFKSGDLDQCLPSLVSVVMDDIFGTAGQEKDAEDYVSSMKEVKSSKSYDSMELLAKNAGVRHLPQLIRPLQDLLREKLNSNLTKKIDELLRRIGVGLIRNPEAGSRDLLMFCYEVLREAYQVEQPLENKNPEEPSRQRFSVNLRGAQKNENRESTTSYVYKLARFAFDILRSALSKHDSLLSAGNVAGFLPMIGDALVQSHEEVKTSAMRLLTTVVKLPLQDLDKNASSYIEEAVQVVKEAAKTSNEAPQAALKLISAILRERRNVEMGEWDLGYLLNRLKSDLEEPDRQGVTFNFIKAVMARKFVVAEMYDLVDSIAAMMVTNHNRGARDLARGAYIQFLVEYPQAKSRWTKQLKFLVRNMEYQYQEGRQSVIEAVHLLLSKTTGDPAKDLVGTFFLPTVMLMANDESNECREMAVVLLKRLFERAHADQVRSFLVLLRSWLEQIDNPRLIGMGLQVYRVSFDSSIVNEGTEQDLALATCAQILKPRTEEFDDDEWEILYYALQLFSKLCKLYPTSTLAQKNQALWTNVLSRLSYPHAWVKSSAASLMGIWLADLARANADRGYSALRLVGTAGLQFDGDNMLKILKASLRVLKHPGVGQVLATQTVRNLVFLGRCFASNGLEVARNSDDAMHTGNEEIEDDEELDDDNVESTGKGNISALHYLMSKTSVALRREPLTTRAPSLIPKTAALQLIAALCNHLDIDQLRPSMQTILLPLQNLTDPSIPAPRSSDEDFQTAYQALVSNSQEVLDLLQKKFGTTDFVAQMQKVREGVKERREGRRTKRRIEAVADPEKFGRDKKKKGERKRERRKEQGMEYRGKRRGW